MPDFLDDVFGPEMLTIEQIKQQQGWPLEYISTVGIAPYVRRLGNEVAGVEIGTGKGESTYFLLEECPGIKKLTTIDPYIQYTDWNGVVTQKTLDEERSVAERNLSVFNDRVAMIRESGSRASGEFQDESLHFVFIDGDHAAPAVEEDLHRWYPKVRRNGIICGSSYGLTGVHQGLHIWRRQTKNTYPILKSLNNTWLFYKR